MSEEEEEMFSVMVPMLTKVDPESYSGWRKMFQGFLAVKGGKYALSKEGFANLPERWCEPSDISVPESEEPDKKKREEREKKIKSALKSNDLAMAYFNLALENNRAKMCVEVALSEEYPDGKAKLLMDRLDQKFCPELREKLRAIKVSKERSNEEGIVDMCYCPEVEIAELKEEFKKEKNEKEIVEEGLSLSLRAEHEESDDEESIEKEFLKESYDEESIEKEYFLRESDDEESIEKENEKFVKEDDDEESIEKEIEKFVREEKDEESKEIEQFEIEQFARKENDEESKREQKVCERRERQRVERE